MVAIEGATVFVTGAGGGLGAEFVEQALQLGAAKVYASARRPLVFSDPRVEALKLDVTHQDAVARAVAAAPDTTILINNAGRPGRTPLVESSLEDIRAVYDTNVFAPIALAQSFAPVLAGNGGGAIVNVLSVMSWVPRPGAYNSSKSALWGATNSLRVELARQGTLVVGAHLSYTDTPMTKTLDVPKASARDIVAAIYSGVVEGAVEVLADDPSRRVKALLAGDVTALEAALFE
ncbi:SDR family oxidoreductase [Curtobacterium flaccumfaciens]|uniref:SDR family oxidoreductase n=1 Tax=Curtobacterium flaccumfaciens TaxID=2035 RepID=UPI003993B914